MSARRLPWLLLALLAASAAAAPPAPAPATPPMPGSYQPAAVDPQIRGVARFAVRAQRAREGGKLKLVEVLHCERQVVAGQNYRLRLMVRRAGHPALAEALVYAALDGSRTLVSWNWVEATAPTGTP